MRQRRGKASVVRRGGLGRSGWTDQRRVVRDSNRFGKRRHLEREGEAYCFGYFNRARPHQGIGWLVPTGSVTSTTAAGSGGVVAVLAERPTSRLPANGQTDVQSPSRGADGESSQCAQHEVYSTVSVTAARLTWHSSDTRTTVSVATTFPSRDTRIV